MFKRLLFAMLLVLSLTLVLTACQGEKGEDGNTPSVEISEDGYWVINGEKTDVKAKGEDGIDGVNGIDGKERPLYYQPHWPYDETLLPVGVLY